MKFSEDQQTEWKENWKDEYLQWISAFANSAGGSLFIGKKNDGTIKGVTNAKKLCEDLPNKILNKLGIVVDVNLLYEGELEYLEIRVKPYPNPISYDGRYYVRSGSTKQLLNGESLTQFLLSKSSSSWESVDMLDLRIDQFDIPSLDLFKEHCSKANRIFLPENVSIKQIFERFSLLSKGYITRAGCLLFFPNPHLLITGAFIKIAYFQSETDIVFQDVIEGTLFQQIEKAVDLLNTKYIIKTIEFKSLSGVEVYPYAERALREALMNAIAHRDYSKGNPIQIKVFRNKLILFNEGSIPIDWTEAEFLGPHSSKPRNPIIANVLYNAGLIERWGLGIQTILQENERLKIKQPEFRFGFDDFTITLFAKAEYMEIPIKNRWDIFSGTDSKIASYFHNYLQDNVLVPSDEPLTQEEVLKFREVSHTLDEKSLDIIVRMSFTPKKRSEVLTLVGVSNQTFNFKSFIQPLMELDLVQQTIKDRANSPNQRYQLTKLGVRYQKFLSMVLESVNKTEE